MQQHHGSHTISPTWGLSTGPLGTSTSPAPTRHYPPVWGLSPSSSAPGWLPHQPGGFHHLPPAFSSRRRRRASRWGARWGGCTGRGYNLQYHGGGGGKPWDLIAHHRDRIRRSRRGSLYGSLMGPIRQHQAAAGAVPAVSGEVPCPVRLRFKPQPVGSSFLEVIIFRAQIACRVQVSPSTCRQRTDAFTVVPGQEKHSSAGICDSHPPHANTQSLTS